MAELDDGHGDTLIHDQFATRLINVEYSQLHQNHQKHSTSLNQRVAETALPLNKIIHPISSHVDSVS
jgi:hypothetical protein